MKRLLLFISTLLCANVLMAQTRFWKGDIQYEVTSTSPVEVEVNDATSAITIANIPETVSYDGITYSVTSIGQDAFEYCSSLTSVTIPNSVTSIGDYAFYYCSSLTSVTIPNSVTSIGHDAFSDCSSLTSVTIPNSVTSIRYNAFEGCSSLTSVNIPNSVTSIESGAFKDCSSLTSINIPNSVTSIGALAFFDCSSLTSVTIPNSVTSIGYQAFVYCSSLTSLTIPSSVTTIGNQAFYGCNNLSSVTCLAETAPSLGNNVFYSTPTTKVLNIPCGSDYSSWESATDWASVECIDIDVDLGNGLTYFPLTFEIISEEERTMKVSNCDESATVVEIPARVMYNGALYDVTSIGYMAFSGCSSLTSIDIPNGVTSIGDAAFRDCSSLTSISIPNGVTSIGDAAFSGCSSLTSIDIPSSVTSIGGSAFRDCSSLTSVTIPNSVTSIGDVAFYCCSSLTSIDIPNSVTTIGVFAFGNCSSLDSVTIGNSVTSIGNYAFYYCSSLTSVTCLKETAPSLGDYVFSSTPSTKTLTVPFGSDYSYWETATTWSKVYHKIPENTTITLSNDFTVTDLRTILNQGVLRITQNGQLINTTSENVSGVYEIETPTLPTDKWSFVGAPFNGYKLEAIKEGTNDVSVSLFDYGTGTWSTGWATVEDQAGAGEGYFLWSFAAEPTIFTTDSETQDDHYTLNNDVVTVTKNLTTHQGGNWMALANPYTFKLDVAEFLEDNTAIKQELQGRCVYRLNEEGAFDPAFDGAINLTEGFFVNFANPEDNTATFNKDQRHIGAKKSIAKKDYLKLTMKDGNKERELYFAQNEEAKQEYDIFDANKLFAPIEITEPYFVTEGNALVKEEVQSLPYTATLNVKSYESKEITFRIDNIPTDINVYLLDNGQDIKMNGGVEYTTNITAGENADRFQILFKKQQKIERAKTNQITIKNYNRHITIQSQITNLNIEVYNTIGQKVLETKSYDFHLDQVPAGSYVVKAYYGRVSQSQKIVIE